MMKFSRIDSAKDEFWLIFDEAADLPFSSRLITDRHLIRVNGVKYEILRREWNMQGGVTLRIKLTDQRATESIISLAHAGFDQKVLDTANAKKPRVRPNILQRVRDMEL